MFACLTDMRTPTLDRQVAFSMLELKSASSSGRLDLEASVSIRLPESKAMSPNRTLSTTTARRTGA